MQTIEEELNWNEIYREKRRTIKKKVWNGSEWITQLYIVVPTTPKTKSWLQKTYGGAEYLGNWWENVHDVIMKDKIYVFWSLAND